MQEIKEVYESEALQELLSLERSIDAAKFTYSALLEARAKKDEQLVAEAYYHLLLRLSVLRGQSGLMVAALNGFFGAHTKPVGYRSCSTEPKQKRKYTKRTQPILKTKRRPGRPKKAVTETVAQ